MSDTTDSTDDVDEEEPPSGPLPIHDRWMNDYAPTVIRDGERLEPSIDPSQEDAS